MTSSKCFPYRPHDYMYDPLFTVSGPTDHYKAAIVAKMTTAKYQICPIFPNMFSDLPNYPRKQLVRRKQPPIAPYTEVSNKDKITKDPALQRTVDVRGSDRYKFSQIPIVNIPMNDILPYQTFPTFTIEKIDKVERHPPKMNIAVAVQTKFRESETQTIPWEPSYKVIGEGDPEILKLDFLKWESGLPAGMHEVQLIERARMKRAWEKQIEPSVGTKEEQDKLRSFIDAMERDEWAFREQEIQDIQDLRMELLEHMLNELHENSNRRNEMKLQQYVAIKEAEKRAKLEKLEKESRRELRKLEARIRGYTGKYRSPDIIGEHIDPKSELYAPLIRHGEHPKRWHQVIDERMKKYRAQFIGVEQFSTLPRWLDQATKMKEFAKKKLPGTRLCIRETKWTTPVLKELHQELKGLRKTREQRPCTLRTKLEKPVVISSTPEVEGIPVIQEDRFQAVVFIQSVIRGRASQMMMYEGRDRCRELIHELKLSQGLLRKQNHKVLSNRLNVRSQQREEMIQINKISILQENLNRLQGTTVGTLLDFLNKELQRLLEERKAHAMCLVNDRERHSREAAEAGRRQYELRRRREHDEMFKQVIKVTQDTVDLYLQDVITEGMQFTSQEEARDYILKLAHKIDCETQEAYERSRMNSDEQEEVVADLVHHFVLPEISKEFARKKINYIQKQNLKTIHESIYTKMENLPKVEKVPSERSSSEISEDEPLAPAEVLQSIPEETSPLVETKVPPVCPKPDVKLQGPNPPELTWISAPPYRESKQSVLSESWHGEQSEPCKTILSTEKFGSASANKTSASKELHVSSSEKKITSREFRISSETVPSSTTSYGSDTDITSTITEDERNEEAQFSIVSSTNSEALPMRKIRKRKTHFTD